MFRGWRKRRERREQRCREDRELTHEVRRRVAEVVGETVEPLIESGAARLEAPAGDSALNPEGPLLRLIPARGDAASVEIAAGPDWITLVLGCGYDQELLVHPTHEWEWELRACIEAVVGGRYREVFTPGKPDTHDSSAGRTEPHGFFETKPGRRSLAMIFELPAENLDLVMEHYGSLEGIEERIPGGERRYAPYR